MGISCLVNHNKLMLTAGRRSQGDEASMAREIGLWIDHRQAVIVILLVQNEELEHISSGVDKHVRYSGPVRSKRVIDTRVDVAEDTRDRRFGNDIAGYYDRVISYLRGADSILIIGPGEAKGELKNRLEEEGLGGRIAGVEAADKMTDGQITAAVRQYFRG
jgi:hypothetical protein